MRQKPEPCWGPRSLRADTELQDTGSRVSGQGWGRPECPFFHLAWPGLAWPGVTWTEESGTLEGDSPCGDHGITGPGTGESSGLEGPWTFQKTGRKEVPSPHPGFS